MTESIVTTNLANFGYAGIKQLRDLLTAYMEISNFDRPEITSFALNKNSGYVWLQTEEYECWMLHDGVLKQHLSSPYSGHEGFYCDLVDYATLTDKDSWMVEDLEWLLELNQNDAQQFPLDTEQFNSIKARV